MAASSGSGGCPSASPTLAAPSSARQRLRLRRSGEYVHSRAFRYGDLCRQVGGSAESVNAQPTPGRQVRSSQGPIPDDAGAEQGGGFFIAEIGRQPVGVRLVHHDVVGVAPIEVPAGEQGGLTQVLPPRCAEPAHSTRVGEPRHPDAISHARTGGFWAKQVDGADDLVARDDAGMLGREVAFGQVEIRAAHSAYGHA